MSVWKPHVKLSSIEGRQPYPNNTCMPLATNTTSPVLYCGYQKANIGQTEHHLHHVTFSRFVHILLPTLYRRLRRTASRVTHVSAQSRSSSSQRRLRDAKCGRPLACRVAQRSPSLLPMHGSATHRRHTLTLISNLTSTGSLRLTVDLIIRLRTKDG